MGVSCDEAARLVDCGFFSILILVLMLELFGRWKNAGVLRGIAGGLSSSQRTCCSVAGEGWCGLSRNCQT